MVKVALKNDMVKEIKKKTSSVHLDHRLLKGTPRANQTLSIRQSKAVKV